MQCDKCYNTHDLRKLGGGGGCHGKKLILQWGKCIRSLKMGGNWIQDYMVMIQSSVNDATADPVY